MFFVQMATYFFGALELFHLGGGGALRQCNLVYYGGDARREKVQKRILVTLEVGGAV